MKKVYTGIFCTLFATGLMAQRASHAAPNKQALPASHAIQMGHPDRGSAIWSDDFSDPNTWMMGGSGANDWVIGTTAPSGDFPLDPIASTTADNGFALYDSDLFCASSDDAYIQNVTPIDLSAFPAVSLTFEEYYRKYQDQTFVEISTDGTNFTSIEVNSDVTSNESTTNPKVVSIPITAMAGGQSTVYIRFRFESVTGCDYSWMVDDVAIVPQEGYNMSLVSAATTLFDINTAATYDSLPYTVYPITEIRPLSVNMRYLNNGAAEATNVTPTITSSDGFNSSINAGTLAPGDTGTYAPAIGYTPTAVQGVYTINYNIAADSTDSDPDDNAMELSVEVNDSTYARDAGELEAAYNDTATGPAFKLGTVYHMIADESLLGISAAFPSTSETGVELNAQLLDPNTADFDPLAETAFHTLTDSDLSPTGGATWVNFYFDSPVALTAGSDVMIAVQHFGGANVLVGASGTSPAQTSFLYRSSSDTWFYVTTTPMVRMILLGAAGISSNDMQNGIGLGQSIPNPAQNTARIDYSLTKAAPVSINLYDMSGKLVRNLVKGNTSPGLHRVDVNTADLEAGVYFYTLTTDKAVTTKRMTVVH